MVNGQRSMVNGQRSMVNKKHISCFLPLTFLLLLTSPVWAADTITVTLTGDILLDRGVRKRIENTDINRLFTQEIDSVFHSSDYMIGNLECPTTKIKSPAFKKFVFRAEPEWLQTLREHGFTHLNLANNHSADQGRKGLSDTFHQVEKYGMVPIGAGENMQQAAQAVMIDNSIRPIYIITSQRLPLENFAYLPDQFSVSQEPWDSLIDRVHSLRQSQPSSYIIVSLHWGWEHQLTPTMTQRIQAHQLVDAGANALVCHHTHTLQTIEEYRGCPIYYSIGNFIFDQTKPINTRACIVKLHISAKDAKAETIPIDIFSCVPRIERK